jgi:hypothetical protein
MLYSTNKGYIMDCTYKEVEKYRVYDLSQNFLFETDGKSFDFGGTPHYIVRLSLKEFDVMPLQENSKHSRYSNKAD